MIYLGIDVAKDSHVAAAITSDGEVVLKPFPFANSCSGFAKLKSRLDEFPCDSLLIGLESTAHYGENLIAYLVQNAYQLEPDDIHLLKLRGLCKTRQNLILLRTRCKIQLGAFVDQLFPELNDFFRAGLHINVSYTLLKLHPRPSEVQSLHLTYLSNLLQKASRGKYTKVDAVHLRELARQSIGTDHPSLALQINQTIAQIELFSEQLNQVDNEIVSIMDILNSPIMTIPGIGHINGAMILSVIGDVTRFSSPAKILAFAGLDPAVMQSGNFTARSTRMSKRGNSMLRYALINAAHNVVRNNHTFAQYYASKVAQGKSHYCALGHTAHKLVRVLFTLLTKNIRFDLP